MFNIEAEERKAIGQQLSKKIQESFVHNYRTIMEHTQIRLPCRSII